MTPAALRAAIASARLRPRMYGTDAHDLSGYLHGLTAGAYDGPLNVAAQWQSAWTTAGWRPNDPRADDVVCDVADRVVAALWPQGDAPARRAAEAGALDLDAIEALARKVVSDDADGGYAMWSTLELARDRVPALVARVRELEAQVAAAQPVLLLDAIRNGRFGAPLPDLSAAHAAWAAEPDTDLCPQCGALDLDHACPKSAATVAGEAFAAKHPYAAAGIMGSATAREGKG